MTLKETNVSEEYKVAATEVLYILEYLPKTETNKIPNKFKEFLNENSIPDYNPNYDFSSGLDKIELKHKTKLLLAMIYKNYLCSEEEQSKYDEILCKNEEQYQKDLTEKYNSNDIFKKEESKKTEIVQELNNALIEYKEPFFKRLKKQIFKILHINSEM